MRRITLFVILCAMVSLFAWGQRRGGAERGRARTVISESNRNGIPTWPVDEQFKHDLFTFVRIQYSSGGRWGGYYGRGGGDWTTDWPDAELNFSWRLQQMTSIKVNPNPVSMRLTDPELKDYPFIYMIEPGNLLFSEEEVQALRKYLLNGGFMMVDDFWGEAEWANFYRQFKRVFPEKEPIELQLDHPIFHSVFDLKEKPQIPSIGYVRQARMTGRTYEREDAQTPHYKAVYDDKNRMIMMICHNTDLGDGWEREGEDEYYFREFSEKKAYPLGINIVFYALTH